MDEAGFLDVDGELDGVLEIDVTVEHDPQRMRPAASEVERLIADASRARDLLGWTPRVSVEEGLAQVVDFIRENPHLYRPREYAV